MREKKINSISLVSGAVGLIGIGYGLRQRKKIDAFSDSKKVESGRLQQ